jgi:hypothetical protein
MDQNQQLVSGCAPTGYTTSGFRMRSRGTPDALEKSMVAGLCLPTEQRIVRVFQAIQDMESVAFRGHLMAAREQIYLLPLHVAAQQIDVAERLSNQRRSRYHSPRFHGRKVVAQLSAPNAD